MLLEPPIIYCFPTSRPAQLSWWSPGDFKRCCSSSGSGIISSSNTRNCCWCNDNSVRNGMFNGAAVAGGIVMIVSGMVKIIVVVIGIIIKGVLC